MSDRSYVCFLWNNGGRKYEPRYVNIWARALKHFDPEARRICVTDYKEGFCEDVEVYPMPDEAQKVKDIPAPQGPEFPSSYRRLWCFAQGAKSLGERIIQLDVDCLILKSPAPLWLAEGNFVGWHPKVDWGVHERFGGGTWMHKTGTMDLWDRFIKNPKDMITRAKHRGFRGSDQAILSNELYDSYPKWPNNSGIYGSQEGVHKWDLPPKDAIIVHFNGHDKPWTAQKLWVRAYCEYFGDKCD